MDMNGGWIVDLDIWKYFDSIDWKYLCDILKQRVRDGVLIRLSGKWMNAGVMEYGQFACCHIGPQDVLWRRSNTRC